MLREEPYCTIRGPKCKGVSITVDHNVPLSTARELAHVRSNMRGACTACNYLGGAVLTKGYARPAAPAVVQVCEYQPECELCTRGPGYDPSS